MDLTNAAPAFNQTSTQGQQVIMMPVADLEAFIRKEVLEAIKEFAYVGAPQNISVERYEIIGRNNIEGYLQMYDHQELARMIECGVLGRALWREEREGGTYKGKMHFTIKTGMPRWRYFKAMTETQRNNLYVAGPEACEELWLQYQREGRIKIE